MSGIWSKWSGTAWMLRHCSQPRLSERFSVFKGTKRVDLNHSTAEHHHSEGMQESFSPGTQVQYRSILPHGAISECGKDP
jgi:hypothetical protein